jgi:ectoine hydroxylase-related dioxygenase (phytanoyl-CoA dioxygenase family)
MQRPPSQGMIAEMEAFVDAIAERGWASTNAVIDAATVESLREVVAPYAIDGRGGARNLLANEEIQALAASPSVHGLAAAVLGDGCFAVRALLFDKTPSANWKVVWHQDLTIAARERVDVPGYGPWTDKAGVPHVQPPADLLEQMLAVRIHLDACTATNGPVRVVDRSHRRGRLTSLAIDELRRTEAECECLVEQGGILAFRPLIVHASAPATEPGHRRVIHIEYAAQSLPTPLEWYQRIA